MKASILPPLFLSVRLPTLLAMFWRAHISREPIAGVSRKEPLSFIVFRLDSLGDVVMTTPLFRALKKAHPGSRCTVVVQECYKSLLVTNPHIDEILTLPKVRPPGCRRARGGCWRPLRFIGSDCAKGISTLRFRRAGMWTRTWRHFSAF
jgi:hypothetical protein